VFTQRSGPGLCGGMHGISQVPREPTRTFALLWDPGRTAATGHTLRRCCPRNLDNEGSSVSCLFEARSHGFGTRCLRFMPPSLTTMQGSLPVGGQPLPGGSFTHRVPLKGFCIHTPPFLGCAWRD